MHAAASVIRVFAANSAVGVMLDITVALKNAHWRLPNVPNSSPVSWSEKNVETLPAQNSQPSFRFLRAMMIR